MTVKWDLEEAKSPRFSVEALLGHFEDGKQIRDKLYAENKDKYDIKSKLMKKYSAWGNNIKPKQRI
jgi:hypothetical protein